MLNAVTQSMQWCAALCLFFAAAILGFLKYFSCLFSTAGDTEIDEVSTKQAVQEELRCQESKTNWPKLPWK